MGSLSPAGQQPPPDGASDLTIIAKRRGDGVVHATFRRLSRMNRRTDRFKARQATLHALIELIPHEHVPHPDGGHRTVEQTKADRDALAARVDAERAQKSIADEIVGNARAIHQRTGPRSEAMIAALSRIPSDHSPLEHAGPAEEALHLVLNQTETDLSANRKPTYLVPDPRPASES